MKTFTFITVLCLIALPVQALEYSYSTQVPTTVQLQGGTLVPVDIEMVTDIDGNEQYRFHYMKFQDTPDQNRIDQYQAADVDVQRYSLKHPLWFDKLSTSEIKDEVAPLLQGGVLKSDLSGKEWSAIVAQYPAWSAGLSVITGQVYSYNDQLYRTLQSHTTQADWTPDIVPALFALSMPPSVIAEWVQPTGAHDAYQLGDKVQYGGQIWISKINANVTVPDGDVPYNRYWEPVK